MTIDELTAHAQEIRDHAVHLTKRIVQEDAVTLYLQFILEAGGRTAIDLIDEAIGKAKA
jgi:hypothetical protein